MFSQSKVSIVAICQVKASSCPRHQISAFQSTTRCKQGSCSFVILRLVRQLNWLTHRYTNYAFPCNHCYVSKRNFNLLHWYVIISQKFSFISSLYYISSDLRGSLLLFWRDMRVSYCNVWVLLGYEWLNMLIDW